MSDQSTSVAQLRDMVQEFVDQRQWHKFHSPKNLSMSLAIEAAELMEHFQWISAPSSRDTRSDPKKLQAVAEELADVLCYTLAMANELQIDLSVALANKMAKNQQKYPAHVYRGRYGPEDQGGTK